MNRQRGLAGANGYCRELKLDLVEWLTHALDSGPVRWLDVCCGIGTALVEAAESFRLNAEDGDLFIEGIDLVGHFPSHEFAPNLLLRRISIEDWIPSPEYDLITCVHGLHYLGDKLSAIRKLVACLSVRDLKGTPIVAPRSSGLGADLWRDIPKTAAACVVERRALCCTQDARAFADLVRPAGS